MHPELPRSCGLGLTLKMSRVLIVDDDVFPENRFQQQIESGDEEGPASAFAMLELSAGLFEEA